MNNEILINLHTHSQFSDGVFSPEALAEQLYEENISIASLTDHNSIEGINRFRTKSNQLGIGTITGLEMSTYHKGMELHLLCYGFNESSSQLNEILSKIQQEKAYPSVKEATSLIHRLGGKTFLAHPWVYYDENEYETKFEQLKQSGIDGIETLSPQITEEQQLKLIHIASKLSLLMSAGTDFHSNNQKPLNITGISVPSYFWKQFRDSLSVETNPRVPPEQQRELYPPKENSYFIKQNQRQTRKNLISRLKILIPAISVLVLYCGILFFYLLPVIEKALIDQKKEMIKELTHSALSISMNYYQLEQSQKLSRKEAQSLAADQITSLRYGDNNLDYFWITDMTPRMIRHPYRPELNGQDLSNYIDTKGVSVFIKFKEAVESNHEGYLEYVWQWMNNEDSREAKISYVQGFEPWNWMIGTGLYIDDLNKEIQRWEENLIIFSLIVILLVAILLTWIVKSSFITEKKRELSDQELSYSREQYRLLADASSAGVLIIQNKKAIYANREFLNLTQYKIEKLLLQSEDDLFPEDPTPTFQFENKNNQQTNTSIKSDLNQLISIFYTVSPITIFEKQAIIVNIQKASQDHHIKQKTNRIRFEVFKEIYSDKESTSLIQRASKDNTLSDINHDFHQMISNSKKMSDLISIAGVYRELMLPISYGTLRSYKLTQNISIIFRQLIAKAAFLIEEEMGKAPYPFALITPGSLGRMEFNLFSDQDSALIIENSEKKAFSKDSKQWFSLYGKRVSEAFTLMGIPECTGAVMCSNPDWVKSSGQWEETLSNWIETPTPEMRLNLNIFLDFDFIYGDNRLAKKLKTFILDKITKTPSFLPHLAKEIIEIKIPAIEEIQIEGSETVKALLQTIQNIARLYCYHLQQPLLNTEKRINTITDSQLLDSSTTGSLNSLLHRLDRIKLDSQLLQLAKEDNIQLISSDIPKLKGELKKLILIQNRIRQDFLRQ